MMKKASVLFLVLLLALGLCSCGSGGEDAPDFEANKIEWTSAAYATKEAQVVSFTTACEKDPVARTTASVNVYSTACDAPEGFSTPDGYAWQKLSLRLRFGDEQANENGYRYCYFLTDYYDMAALQNSITNDESRQCDTFTVRWEDKKYKKCLALISKTTEDWEMDEESGLQSCSEILSWTVLLPEGYDGLCCGIYDAALEGTVDTPDAFIEHYDAKAFLLYRLDAVK